MLALGAVVSPSRCRSEAQLCNECITSRRVRHQSTRAALGLFTEALEYAVCSCEVSSPLLHLFK